jgi:flagellar motor switch protein FliG
VDPAIFGVLIAECSADKLAIALSTAGPAIRELFLTNMSERAGNMLRDEVETMPTPRKKAIEEAQAEIVLIAKRLAKEGRIFLLEEGENADTSEDVDT